MILSSGWRGGVIKQRPISIGGARFRTVARRTRFRWWDLRPPHRCWAIGRSRPEMFGSAAVRCSGARPWNWRSRGVTRNAHARGSWLPLRAPGLDSSKSATIVFIWSARCSTSRAAVTKTLPTSVKPSSRFSWRTKIVAANSSSSYVLQNSRRTATRCSAFAAVVTLKLLSATWQRKRNCCSFMGPHVSSLDAIQRNNNRFRSFGIIALM